MKVWKEAAIVELNLKDILNDLENKYGDFIKIANGDIFQGKFESNVL